MENNEYQFLVERDEFYSFLSFCEVNKIIINPDNYLPFTKNTFVLKGNEVKVIKLSDRDYCDDWDDFVNDYYRDLFYGKSTKDIISKLKSDRYSFDGLSFIYGDFLLEPEVVLGYLDNSCDLLEIIFESSEPIGHPEKPTVEYKSYLDFNPLKRA